MSTTWVKLLEKSIKNQEAIYPPDDLPNCPYCNDGGNEYRHYFRWSGQLTLPRHSKIDNVSIAGYSAITIELVCHKCGMPAARVRGERILPYSEAAMRETENTPKGQSNE